MISEEILEELKCATSDEEHFIIEPISLNNCGHSICKKCMPKERVKEIKCKLCGLVSQHDDSKIHTSKDTQKLLHTYIEEIFKILKDETSLKLNGLKEIVKEKSELLEIKMQYIEEEIDVRIESLINQVFAVGDRMKAKLKDVKIETLKQPKIDEFNLTFNKLEENIKNKINLNEDYLEIFQKKLKDLNNTINETNEIKIPDFKFSTEIIDDGSLIGHFTTFGELKPMKEVSFHSDSLLYRMALLENNSKILINDFGRDLLYLCDLDGNILKSVNPNNIFKDLSGVCVLRSDSNNEEKIFVGDDEDFKIFVFNSNLELQFQFSDENLRYSYLMQIDNEFDKSRLYVSDHTNNEITIWNTSNGAFIDKIDIETPNHINFTESSLFASSPVFDAEVQNNKVMKIEKGSNCIYEIDKYSLEIKRKIIGNWYTPWLLNIESDGNLHIVAQNLQNNITKSEMKYFFTIDKNGKIIKKVYLDGLEGINDVILVKTKIIALWANKFKIFEFE